MFGAIGALAVLASAEAQLNYGRLDRFFFDRGAPRIGKRKPLPQGVKTNKRAKVKAARKANRSRRK